MLICLALIFSEHSRKLDSKSLYPDYIFNKLLK